MSLSLNNLHHSRVQSRTFSPKQHPTKKGGAHRDRVVSFFSSGQGPVFRMSGSPAALASRFAASLGVPGSPGVSSPPFGSRCTSPLPGATTTSRTAVVLRFGPGPGPCGSTHDKEDGFTSLQAVYSAVYNSF